MKIIHPLIVIDRLIKKNELGQPFKLMEHQREILRLAFDFDNDGRLPWDTILYSCIKKSGKTTINGALTLAWGFTQEAPNEILILANDLEQTLARVYKTMEGIIKHNPELQREAEVQTRTIFLANGTTLTAISGDYQGAAGSNHGFVSYDELWGYTSEASTRLWEELTPVPTRKNSIRFISTYAGFEGESKLLWDLYKQVVTQDEHPEGQGERLHPDLPIFCNREARLFAYWDHEPRMPWQTETYYQSQKKTLRPGTFLRLHRNQWATSEEIFITGEMWDPCVNHAHHPSITDREPLFVGVDLGIKHDNAARVAVKWDENGERLILVSHRIWKPSPSQPLDLEHTVEQDLRDLDENGDVVEILVDPYQAHQSVTTLQAVGLPIREFPQTQANCTLMGQTLFDLLTGQNLVLYASDELRQQALSTVAVENPRGWRLAKEKASKKIDAIVALAMACCAAMAHRGEIGNRAARGFNRSLHVAKENINPSPGPVYIGQTVIDVPATVIAQENRGANCVLAAFASEGAGLRKHLETVVKPWLLANARWAFHNRRIVGVCDADPRTQYELLEIINETLGGDWEPAANTWEIRREAILDLLGKSAPFAFTPALQISPGARLLIESLSGRWSYEKDRRDQRNIWYHVANALGLVIGSLQAKQDIDNWKPPVIDNSPIDHFADYRARGWR
jgi:phage terminase large subunit-like protein